MLADQLASLSTKIAIIATILLFFFVVVAILLERAKVKYDKKILFIIIIFVTVLPTFFFIGSTAYINSISSSRGPVHWHADIEVYACGKELDFVDPVGFSNKVGTPVLHEHNDKRVHLEGVVVEESDASLGNFFGVIGGKLGAGQLIVPTTNGVQEFTDGSTCPDGTVGTTQTFVYRSKDGVYTQEKVANAAGYIIAPFSQVPAGDCIIVEYGEEKDMTDRLCRSYRVAEEIGKLKKGNYGN